MLVSDKIKLNFDISAIKSASSTGGATVTGATDTVNVS